MRYSFNCLPQVLLTHHSFKKYVMKKNQSLGLVIACSALLFSACISSCKKESSSTTPNTTTNNNNNNNQIPDAIFKATVSGAQSQNIDVKLVGNTFTDHAVNGSLVSSIGLFSISCMKNPTTSVDETWNVGLFAEMKELKAGTYQMNTNDSYKSGYYNYALSKTGYTSTSGSIIISKVVAGQTVGNSVGAGNDYYIDGSFEMTLVDSENPPGTVNITGTFSGVNIKTN